MLRGAAVDDAARAFGSPSPHPAVTRTALKQRGGSRDVQIVGDPPCCPHSLGEKVEDGAIARPRERGSGALERGSVQDFFLPRPFAGLAAAIAGTCS